MAIFNSLSASNCLSTKQQHLASKRWRIKKLCLVIMVSHKKKEPSLTAPKVPKQTSFSIKHLYNDSIFLALFTLNFLALENVIFSTMVLNCVCAFANNLAQFMKVNKNVLSLAVMLLACRFFYSYKDVSSTTVCNLRRFTHQCDFSSVGACRKDRPYQHQHSTCRNLSISPCSNNIGIKQRLTK